MESKTHHGQVAQQISACLWREESAFSGIPLWLASVEDCRILPHILRYNIYTNIKDISISERKEKRGLHLSKPSNAPSPSLPWPLIKVLRLKMLRSFAIGQCRLGKRGGLGKIWERCAIRASSRASISNGSEGATCPGLDKVDSREEILQRMRC
eukprot:1382127-Amorphochlora_amoeboformis.AAC.1